MTLADGCGWRRRGRGAFFALALLALLLKVAVPPGFMVAPPGVGSGLVICTGHGPLVDFSHARDAPSKSKGDAPCAFAGHAAPPTPAESVALCARAQSFVSASDLLPADLAPGRGLAAPPPPSRGPPTSL